MSVDGNASPEDRVENVEMVVPGKGVDFGYDWSESLGVFPLVDVPVDYCMSEDKRPTVAAIDRRTVVVFHLVADATVDVLGHCQLSAAWRDKWGRAHPVLSQLVPLVRASLKHLSCILLFLLVGDLRERHIGDIEEAILLFGRERVARCTNRRCLLAQS